MTEGAPGMAARPVHRGRRVRFPLWVKLAILSAALAVAPLVGAWIGLVNINSETIKAQSREYQDSITEDVGERVNAELVAAQDGLDGVGKVLADTSQGEQARVALASALVASNSAIDHAAIYSADGQLIDRIAEHAEGIPPSPAALDAKLRAEADSKEVALGGSFAASGEVRVLVVVPVRPEAAGGKVTAYVASAVSLAGVQKRIEFLATNRYGTRDAVFLVDGDLTYLAHPDVSRALARESAAGVGILAGIDAGALANGAATFGEYRGEHGEEMIGTVKPLTPRPWAVVAQVPRRVAYASLGRMLRIVRTAAIAAIAIAILAALALARAVTAPIPRLVAFARDLAERRWDRRIAVATRDELSLVAGAMSDAAADLEASEATHQKELAIRADLGRYLPAEIVERVVRREQDMRLGGSKRPITVMFADVVGFTPIAERLPPEETVGFLNQLFTIQTEIVFKHGGTVDKFIGDAIMAVWGAPEPQEDHAARALAAALDLLRWVEVAKVGWKEKLGVDAQLAIGINTGCAVVGNIGSERRMEYTAIGDTVNVAARLEAIARPMQVLITRATRDAAGDAFDYRSYGEKKISGRGGQVEVYEVLL